jgi:hypothetical protein
VVLASSVGWVVGFEFTIFHHALEDARIKKFGFLDQTLHHLLGCGLCFFLDEGDHGDVALYLNVFAQV